MTTTSKLITWSARSLAVALALFLSLFALDAFNGDGSIGSKILDYTRHLAPTWICLLVVALAWKREWLGAVAFTGLAAFYAWWAWDHKDWILVISGPLLLVAGLYLLAWRMRKSTRNQ